MVLPLLSALFFWSYEAPEYAAWVVCISLTCFVSWALYRIAQKIEKDNRRKVFFVAGYAISLAILIAGVAMRKHANTLTGWDALGVHVFGTIISAVGFCLTASITGAIIARKVAKMIAARKAVKKQVTEANDV